MNRLSTLYFGCTLAGLLLSACSDDPAPTTVTPDAPAAPLVVTAGSVRLDLAEGDAPEVDRGRLGLENVDAYYELTTPSGEPFSFDIVSRREGNRGDTQVSVAHASTGGRTPDGDVQSLAVEGIVVSSRGDTRSRPLWIESRGDGFARLTLRGSIEEDQIIAVEVQSEGEDEPSCALVNLRIGEESEISVSRQEDPPPPSLERELIYSSDSSYFGLPTIAVSGDRTSIVTYEGDRNDPFRFERYELRMQYNPETEAVTGGGSPEASQDSCYWRDHEIAALFNVLVLATGGASGIELKLSFDRGATFGQKETFRTGSSFDRSRLVQIGMALDYSLALVFWSSAVDGSRLILIEGSPSAFDDDGSPTKFTFDAPKTVHESDGDATPILMDVEFSEGGDLVIAYGYTTFRVEDRTWTSTTQNRIAVRQFGESFVDTLVEQNSVVSKDPNVALLGSGESMKIFYAYEAPDGIRLRMSDDAAKTFSEPEVFGDRSSSQPTVFARSIDDRTRVDVVYLAGGFSGTEIHSIHWRDFGLTTAQESRLTEAKTETTVDPTHGFELPRITQVAWFGYDAVLDGDDIVIVYDEETTEAYAILEVDARFDNAGGFTAAEAAANFVPAEPPPLAPGLTEAMPAPDPEHRHRLYWLRLGD